jgi:glycosyltransferase involved in cell wall biosynthesis
MRPGVVWQFIDSSGVGGAERHVATLAEGLLRHGQPARVILLQDHGKNAWLQQLAAASISYEHLDGRFSTLRAALKTQRPSLLHTHGYKAGILGRFAGRLTGIPVVSTFHSGERGPFPVGLYDMVDDWTSRLGERIAVSERIRQRLPSGTHVIPSYVATPDHPNAAALPPVVGFVGRLSEEKGPDAFCALAARAATDARFKGVTWQMWGDGPMRRDLEAKFAGVVNFHGVATDMAAVWPQIGLLAMPSRFEGVPLAALEAAAHGIPVLASRVGGLPTVVDEGRTGWLFPVGNLDVAMQHLDAWQALRQTPASGVRQACWAKARMDFSEARWLPEIAAVYQKVGVNVNFPQPPDL